MNSSYFKIVLIALVINILTDLKIPLLSAYVPEKDQKLRYNRPVPLYINAQILIAPLFYIRRPENSILIYRAG